jgi:hypothetical protein
MFENLDKAEQQVARALVEQPTLLVMDNLESILAPSLLAIRRTRNRTSTDSSQIPSYQIGCARSLQHSD